MIFVPFFQNTLIECAYNLKYLIVDEVVLIRPDNFSNEYSERYPWLQPFSCD